MSTKGSMSTVCVDIHTLHRTPARSCATRNRRVRQEPALSFRPMLMAPPVVERGYSVLRQAVPRPVVDAALRHIHLDVVERGLPADTLGSWLWSAHWFPHLRWDPPVVALAWHLPEELRDGEMCDPQILLQPPDNGESSVAPHVDEEPGWANGRRYHNRRRGADA